MAPLALPLCDRGYKWPVRNKTILTTAVPDQRSNGAYLVLFIIRYIPECSNFSLRRTRGFQFQSHPKLDQAMTVYFHLDQ